MLDVPQLEKQWSKYHFKQMLPRYVGTLVLLLLIGAGSFYTLEHKEALLALLDQTNVKEKAPVKHVIVKERVHAVEVPIEEVYTQNVLYPSYTFLEPIELAYIKYNNAQKLALLAAAKKTIPKKKTHKKVKPKKRTVKKPVKKVKKPVKKSLPATRTVKTTVPVVSKPDKETADEVIVLNADQTPKTEVPRQSIIKVGNTKTSEDEIRSIIKRFNRKKKPALSLFISRKYYVLGNYEGALKYAEETYKLNPRIEAAILLYAQSAVKLGKKNDALKKLDKYLKTSSSHKAKKLRDDIQKGTFQ